MLFRSFKTSSNIVYSCQYHIAWSPKYRRKVLVGEVETRLIEIIQQVAFDYEVSLIELHTNQDYIHIICEVDPQFGVMPFVKKCKAKSSNILREEFIHLKTKLPTLWTNSVFISTVGNSPIDFIEHFINNQSTSERPKEKNKWLNFLNNINKFI